MKACKHDDIAIVCIDCFKEKIATLQKDNDNLKAERKNLMENCQVAGLELWMKDNASLRAELDEAIQHGYVDMQNLYRTTRERAEKAEAERDQLKADSVAGWRSCIDHIIKPESSCPVCEIARLREALEEIATTGEKTDERAPRFVAIEALNHKEG